MGLRRRYSRRPGRSYITWAVVLPLPGFLGMWQRHNSTTVPMQELGARLHSGLELIHAIVLPFVNAQARLV